MWLLWIAQFRQHVQQMLQRGTQEKEPEPQSERFAERLPVPLLRLLRSPRIRLRFYSIAADIRHPERCRPSVIVGRSDGGVRRQPSGRLGDGNADNPGRHLSRRI